MMGEEKPDRERQSHTHRAEGSGIEPVAGDEGRDRLAAEIEISCLSTERIASRCMKFLISSHSLSGWMSPSVG
jgi:hypothetical protein